MVVQAGWAGPATHAHQGEASRLAWVVRYSRLLTFPRGKISTSHMVEAWIDVEDGSFLGRVSCG